MSNPVVRRFPDAEAVSRAAAEEFVRASREAIAARSRCTVALSGGSTPKRLYQLLAEPPFVGQVDWPKIEFFWGDERAVPPDHKDSNFHTAHEALLQKITVPAGHVHRLQAERVDRDRAASDYQAEIARVFGASTESTPPTFDLVLLGMGPDGHTASLFPFTTALKEQTRWVVANHVPKLNADRLTLTAPILNRAREVLFLVAGADKAQPLSEVLEGPADNDRLPSQRIRPEGKLIWFVDQAAAAKLRNS